LGKRRWGLWSKDRTKTKKGLAKEVELKIEGVGCELRSLGTIKGQHRNALRPYKRKGELKDPRKILSFNGHWKRQGRGGDSNGDQC